MNSTQVNAEKWADYGIAFDWFNHDLFGDELTPSFFFPSSDVSEYGIFNPNNHSSNPNQKVYSIGFNPQIEQHHPLRILGFIACQMIHQWYYETKGHLTENYCGKIILNKYQEIGLKPLLGNNGKTKRDRMRVDFEISTEGKFKKSAEFLICREEEANCNENFLKKIIFPKRTAAKNSLEERSRKQRSNDGMQQFICPNCNFRVYVEHKAPSWCSNCAPNLSDEFMSKVFYFRQV